MRAAAGQGLDKRELETLLPRRAEVPFDSDRKRMTTVHAIKPGSLEYTSLVAAARAWPDLASSDAVAFAKGAIDELLETVVFTVLTLSQMGNALALRSFRDSFFSLQTNRLLIGAVLSTFALQIAVVHIPFFQGIFRTVGLSLAEWGFCIAFSGLVFSAVEFQKWTLRQRSTSQMPAGVDC